MGWRRFKVWGWGVALVSFSFGRAAPLTPMQVEALRKEIGRNFFVPDPLPPPQAVTFRRFSPAPGVTAEALTYATELGMRVPAVLYLPSPLPAGRIPGLVIVDGHGGDKYCWYSYYGGILYARAGCAVLTYDQAGEGERNTERKSGTREHDRLAGGEPMARRLAGLMITDAREAVSTLRDRPEVDPERIGMAGYSLGSLVVASTGAVEPRIKAAVLAGGGNLSQKSGGLGSKPMCTGWPYRSLEFLGDRPAVLYALQAARGPTLVWNGREDDVAKTEHTQETFFAALQARASALTRDPSRVFQFGFTAGGGHRPYFLTKPVALWLNRELRFPLWSEASIQSMPETRIGAWAKATGVRIDPLYATENREAGMLALGSGVPGYTRESLSVFSADDWSRRREELTFASWTERADRSTAPSP